VFALACFYKRCLEFQFPIIKCYNLPYRTNKGAIIITEYIVVFNEEKVQGFVDRDDLEGATFDLELGEDYKVYRTSVVLYAIKNSEIDSKDKQSLTKKLSKDADFSFTLPQELDEVLADLDYELEF